MGMRAEEENGGVRVDAFAARCCHKHTHSPVTDEYHIENKNRSVVCAPLILTASLGETVMKSLKLVAGLASITTLFLTLTPSLTAQR